MSIIGQVDIYIKKIVKKISIIPLGMLDLPDPEHEHTGQSDRNRNIDKINPLILNLQHHELGILEPVTKTNQIAVADNLDVEGAG